MAQLGRLSVQPRGRLGPVGNATDPGKQQNLLAVTGIPVGPRAGHFCRAMLFDFGKFFGKHTGIERMDLKFVIRIRKLQNPIFRDVQSKGIFLRFPVLSGPSQRRPERGLSAHC